MNDNRNKFLKFIFFFFLVSPIVSCGGGGSSSSGEPALALENFSVIGNISDPDEVIISPSFSSGEFLVSWDSSKRMHHASLFLSSDGVVDDNDIKVAGYNCNIPVFQFCGDSMTVICRYNSDLTIGCEENYDFTNVSSVVSSIPSQAYLLVSLCDGVDEEVGCLFDGQLISLQ